MNVILSIIIAKQEQLHCNKKDIQYPPASP
jgi:hypothetical protein